MGWRKGLWQRARQGIPALLEVDALLQAQGVLAALPGAGSVPGVVGFRLAPGSCEALQQHGLGWLEPAQHGRGPLAGRVAQYRPWRSGAGALAEVGALGLPQDWPAYAAVFGCRSLEGRHWLLVLPARGQLWLGWQR